MAYQELWLSVLKRLKPTIKKAHFITWFQDTELTGKRDNVLLVRVPTPYAQSWIESKYNVKILQAAQELDPDVKQISYIVESGKGADVKAMFEDSEKKVRKVRNVNEVRITKDGSSQVSKVLNDRYRFHNFIVGIDNRLPHAACQAVSKTPGGTYNPLYIYGKSGLGKTHLLQAIGNETLREYPEMVVHYLTAEKFVSEVVEAIGKRYMPKFKDRYRNVDCLLIDDVQFFANKNSSQQEFFHTFNELYNANKQIVITSDRPPSELDNLDERLQSRFAMGMVVELIVPDFETRLAILQQKCKEFQMIIDPEVLYFIANNVKTSVRELEGVLRQMLADSDFFNRVSTIKTAAEIIRRMNKAQKIVGFDVDAQNGKPIVKSAEDVMEIVSLYYNVGVDEMIGQDRRKEFMNPRQVCMYLIKNELGFSYQKIGGGFGGRNHTTVMHSCNKTAKLLKKDIRLVRDINAIKREMGL